MTTLSILNMIFVIGLVVGGFLFFSYIAMKKESAKKDAE